MDVYIISVLIFSLAAIGMATGSLLRGNPLKGTCATLKGGGRKCMSCDTCPFRRRPHEHDRVPQEVESQ